MACGRFKDLNRRIFVDKVYVIKHLILLKVPNWYQRGLASMVYKCFDKKSPGSGIKNDNFLTKIQQKNYTKQLLENLIKEKYIHL